MRFNQTGKHGYYRWIYGIDGTWEQDATWPLTVVSTRFSGWVAMAEPRIAIVTLDRFKRLLLASLERLRKA